MMRPFTKKPLMKFHSQTFYRKKGILPGIKVDTGAVLVEKIHHKKLLRV